MLLVHSGNRIDEEDRPAPRFPPEQVGHVTTAVAELLVDLEARAVVSAPANGADLIVLGEAQRLGIATHIVLPLTEADFQRRSVETSDGRWVERYREVLRRARESTGSSVEIVDLGADPEWYLTAHELLIARARELAGDGAVIALTVRPKGGESPPSNTDEFARLAEDAGLDVVTIDPRPG